MKKLTSALLIILFFILCLFAGLAYIGINNLNKAAGITENIIDKTLPEGYSTLIAKKFDLNNENISNISAISLIAGPEWNLIFLFELPLLKDKKQKQQALRLFTDSISPIKLNNNYSEVMITPYKVLKLSEKSLDGYSITIKTGNIELNGIGIFLNYQNKTIFIVFIAQKDNLNENLAVKFLERIINKSPLHNLDE